MTIHHSDTKPHDERFMRLAIALGNRNLGRTWPNPSVGAVFVDEKSSNEPRIVATGITQPSGRPHAERIAIAKLGEKAMGTTAYVSLEPCAHHGKTSPCCDALIAAGVKRVITSLTDPDVRVTGQGHQRLRDAGIEVVTNVLSAEGYRAHIGHIMRVVQKRPAVTLKLAMTADGYAASADHEPLPISGSLAMAHVHMMRAKSDAILIGSGTLKSDDPMLNVRLAGLEHLSPVRVVLDTHLLISTDARLLKTADIIPTWVFYVSSPESEVRARIIKIHHPMAVLYPMAADVYRITRSNPSKEEGVHVRLPLESVLNILAEQGITRVFSEGGPKIAEALAMRGLIDEFIISKSDKMLDKAGYLGLKPLVKTYIDIQMHLVKAEIIDTDTFSFHERSHIL